MSAYRLMNVTYIVTRHLKGELRGIKMGPFLQWHLCVQWAVKIRSHSYSERIIELPLGIFNNNPNGNDTSVNSSC